MTTIAKLRRDIKLGKACVAHWVRMKEDPMCDEGPGPDDCAYCQEYYGSGEDHCLACPIRAHTDQESCGDTPYDEAEAAFAAGEPEIWQTAATAEIDFLNEIVRNLQAKLRRRERKGGG